MAVLGTLAALATIAIAPPAAADRPPGTAREHPPAAAQPPAAVQPQAVVQPPVARRSPVTGHSSAVGQPPAAGQPPVVGQPPIAGQPPTAGQALATEKSSVAGQSPVVPVSKRASDGAESSPVMRPGRAVRYWTPAKQAKAKAAELPSTQRPLLATSAQRMLSVPVGKRITPGGDANGYARVHRPYSEGARSRVNGRLFFVNAGGRGDSCSASVVSSASRLLVVTAAHCVYSVPEGAARGKWHSSFAFVPAYDGRAAGERQREPYGRWGGRRAWKPDGYTGLPGGDWNSTYDVALIEVGRRGRTLQDAVGAFTPMRNQGGRHTIVTDGYPGVLGRKPYDGRDQLWCLARTQPARSLAAASAAATAPVTAYAAPAPAPAAITAAVPATTPATKLETYNCHLSKGHSGGPWILKGTRDLIGVLSAGTEDGQADGYSVANALNIESYGAIVGQADPRGVYDALSIKATGPAHAVRQGEVTAVTATVTMRGLMGATEVPVTFRVPPGASLTAVSGASCRHAAQEATCVISAIRPGRPVQLTARIRLGRDAAKQVPVTAHVAATRLDPSQRDNTAVFRVPSRA
ncbi:serine protease [Nonomuraea sp. NPDC050783]|uniref:trypsin-like serine peptidase n=1 Tax=Nonomuraea sp. NPDC050783 TaxID=3154634 RepID=UPI0034676A22